MPSVSRYSQTCKVFSLVASLMLIEGVSYAQQPAPVPPAMATPSNAQENPGNGAVPPVPPLKHVDPEDQAMEIKRRKIEKEADMVEAEARLERNKAEKEKASAELRKYRESNGLNEVLINNGLPPLPGNGAGRPGAVAASQVTVIKDEVVLTYTILAVHPHLHEVLLRIAGNEKLVHEGAKLPDGAKLKAVRIDQLVTEKDGKEILVYVN